VLRHNFRNDLNVVTGFTERAIDTVDDPELASELERVVDTAERLLRVGETSRRVERLLADRPAPSRIDLDNAVDEALVSLPSELREGADIEVDVPEGSRCRRSATSPRRSRSSSRTRSATATPSAHVSRSRPPNFRASRGPRSSSPTTGRGFPTERSVLTGEETPLEHASGLGLWYVNWIVSAGGGSFDISSASAGGTRIEMELRTLDDG